MLLERRVTPPGTARKGGDYICKTATSRSENVRCCVDVAMTINATLRTCIVSYYETFPASGAVRRLEQLQVCVEELSSISSKHAPARSSLYLSMVRNELHFESTTDFAIRVVTIAKRSHCPS